jgi:hypothetical protein
LSGEIDNELSRKPQLVQIDGALHGTLGLINYDEMDYKKSIQEYQGAVKDNVKDDASHFFMAYGYINLMAQASTILLVRRKLNWAGSCRRGL